MKFSAKLADRSMRWIALLALILPMASAAIGTVSSPTAIIEQLDGGVVDVCGMTIVLRSSQEQAHVAELTPCVLLFRDGFE